MISRKSSKRVTSKTETVPKTVSPSVASCEKEQLLCYTAVESSATPEVIKVIDEMLSQIWAEMTDGVLRIKYQRQV